MSDPTPDPTPEPDADPDARDPAIAEITGDVIEQIQANVTEPHAPTELDPTREPILEVENLRMYFPVKSGGIIRRTVGHVQAVDGVSFQVPAGGSLGLVGESGCGKSTTGPDDHPALHADRRLHPVRRQPPARPGQAVQRAR